MGFWPIGPRAESYLYYKVKNTQLSLQFQLSVVEPKPRQSLHSANTKNADNPMHLSKLEVNSLSWVVARENVWQRSTIGLI